MKSTIRKSLHTLFLASYIFSASCFAKENETLKEKRKSQKKYLLFSLPVAAIVATYLFSKRSDTSNDPEQNQIPQENNTSNNNVENQIPPSNNNGGGQTRQGSKPLNNNRGGQTPQGSKPLNNNRGGQTPPSNNNGEDQNPQEDRYVKEVKKVLKEKDDVNQIYGTKSDTLLCYYLKKGKSYKEAVRYLVAEKGADVNLPGNKGKTPLNLACLYSDKDIVTLLLNYGADVKLSDEDHRTPLHCICMTALAKAKDKDTEQDKIDIASLLIKKGVNINQVSSEDNHTALRYACANGHIDIIDIILSQDNKVSLDTKNKNNSNLLIDTCTQYSANVEDIIKKLVELNHFDINDKNSLGQTALHMACHTKTKNLVEYLISKGADANLADNEGNLPAHFVCDNYSNGVAIANYLKQQSLLIEKENKENVTPFQKAKTGAFEELTKVLTETT